MEAIKIDVLRSKIDGLSDRNKIIIAFLTTSISPRAEREASGVIMASRDYKTAAVRDLPDPDS